MASTSPSQIPPCPPAPTPATNTGGFADPSWQSWFSTIPQKITFLLNTGGTYIVGGSASGYGVQGTSGGTYGTSAGVLGTSANSDGVSGTSTNSNGVEGASFNGDGVKGGSTNSYGVVGSSSAGVYGSSAGVMGTSALSPGVYGTSTSSIGVQGSSSSGAGGSFASVSGYGVEIITSSGVALNVHAGAGKINSNTIEPITDNAYSCGVSGNSWMDGSTYTAFTVVSDARTKTNIRDSELGLEFINKLRPVSYTQLVAQNIVTVSTFSYEQGAPKKATVYKTTRPGVRTHHGLLAQEVKAALTSVGIPDAALWVMANPKDPESNQALRYEELICPLIAAFHQYQNEMQKTITGLNDRIQALEKVE